MNKFALSVTTAVLLLGSSAFAIAAEKSSPGVSGNAPGHEMQEHGSVPGQPGASGYAPGHQDRDRAMGRDRDDRSARANDSDKMLKGNRDRDDHSARGDRDDKMLKKDRDDRLGRQDRDDKGMVRDRDDRTVHRDVK